MNNNNQTILIMAGGTGGHVFPALSVAEYLIAKGAKVEWLGTKSGLEASVIGATDIPLHFISISGLRGKSMWKKLLSPLLILIALCQSMIKLIKIKPGCVLGMGGFVTGPAGLAAWLLGVKLCIHEQNAVAGFSNQLLSPLAYRVMEAFPGAFERKLKITTNKLLKLLIKPVATIHVGNPVRADILASPQPVQRYLKSAGKIKLLVVGGSLGAVAINKVVAEMMGLYSSEARPEILHQCGKKNLEQTEELYRQFKVEENETIKIQPFINDMAAAYCWADLVICRSGALTVSEIASVGIPSILIPYPSAVDDHQSANAKVLENVDAAFVVQEKALTAQVLSGIVDKFIENRSLVLTASSAARSVAEPAATELAAEICLECCHA